MFQEDLFKINFQRLPFEIREKILAQLNTMELLYFIVHTVSHDCDVNLPQGSNYLWLSHLFSRALWRSRRVSRWDLAIIRQAIRLKRLPQQLEEHLISSVDTLDFSNIREGNVVAALSPVIDFKGVKELDLSGSVILDEFALESILLSQPQLQKLNVSKMPSLSDQLLILLPTRLKSLDISHNPRVTDAGLLRYLNKIDTLISINLAACNRINNWPLILQIISKTQPAISDLGLAKNDSINLSTLFKWLADTDDISHSIDMRNLNNWSSSSILSSCRNSLKTLDVRDCIDFTKSDVRKLGKILANTNVLHNALMEDYSSSSIAQYVRYISGMSVNNPAGAPVRGRS